MTRLLASLIAAGLLGTSSVAQAEGLRAVRSLEGFKCMMPNMTEAQMLHDPNSPSIMQQPSSGAREIGQTAAQVIVYDPVRTENGFVEVLALSGQSGWVQSSQLIPYRSVSNPSARCIPSMMSNGRPGFAFR